MPGSFTWDEEAQGWVWMMFNAFQWDLDWSNPAVLEEFAEMICFLANAGAEVFRLDAIAFLWKRRGTSCQNQPEVHALTQAQPRRGPYRLPRGGVQGRGDGRPQDLLAYSARGATTAGSATSRTTTP